MDGTDPEDMGVSERPKIRKAIVPAAGLGTRMLPQSLATPKELLPLYDARCEPPQLRPLLHFVVEEAAAAGVEEVILVVSPDKQGLTAYFETPDKVLDAVSGSKRAALIQSLQALKRRVKVRAVVQEEPKGLGHAVHCARAAVGGEPFAVLLPDEIFDGRPGPLEQMIDTLPSPEAGSVALLKVPWEQTHRYGIVASRPGGALLHLIDEAVEKPQPHEAPSQLAIVGRYLLPADTFALLETLAPGARGEIELTHALSVLAAAGRLVGVEATAARFDTGNPAGWLRAVEHFAGRG